MTATAKKYNGDKGNNNRYNKKGKLQIKVFTERDSLLTDLTDKSMRTIYNVGVSLVVALFLYSAQKDYIREGKPYFGLKLIKTCFSPFHVALFIWIGMFASSLMIYVGFVFWTHLRSLLEKNYTLRRMWDFTCLITFISYIPGLLYFATRLVLNHNLGVASSVAVLMEATRFLMKTYAFVRSNCPKCLNRNESVTFSAYFYFLFVPTLVYRDEYPRCKRNIRWYYVAQCFFEFVMGIFVFSIIFENSFRHDLKDYGLKPYTSTGVIMIILQNTHYGHFLLIVLSYSGYHSYFNGMAEILKFSDRMFYKDWWTVDSFNEFFQKWNVSVHDWLYTYVYKDCYELVGSQRQYLAKATAFMISAVFHDYIFCFSGRFFIPIVTIDYIILVLIIKLKYDKFGNMVMWCMFGIGTSSQLTICFMEYFARVNCPLQNATIIDVLKPRFISC